MSNDYYATRLVEKEKAGIMKDPVEMDNGVGGGPTGAWATSEVKTTATAPAKETETA